MHSGGNKGYCEDWTIVSDIEKLFNPFVREFGGTVVRDVVGNAPPFYNADYLFDEYRVVAELKCLEDDKLGNPRFIEKTSSLYLQAFQAGATRKVLFGTRSLSSNDFAPDYEERFIQLYEQSIRNSIEKANHQIEDTKQHLGKADYEGVLLLVNEKNRALDPAHVVQHLDRILSEDSHSSINNAIFFTVSLKAQHPSGQGEYMVWVPMLRRRSGNESFERFERAMRDSWYGYLERTLGISIPRVISDMNSLASLANKKDK